MNDNSTANLDPLDLRLTGVHSIEASAGTGKTYTITTLYVRYILETDCSVDDILVTTYTEAATAELKQRLRGRLREALELLRSCSNEAAATQRVADESADETMVGLLRQAGSWRDATRESVRISLETALLNFDHAPVFTIHGFCKRVLQELVFETTSLFDSELVTSLDGLIRDAVADFVAQWWTTEESRIARWLPVEEGFWKLLHKVAAAVVDNPHCDVKPNHERLEVLLESGQLDEFPPLAQQFARQWPEDRVAVEATLFAARDNGWLNKQTHGGDGQLEKAIAFLDAFAKLPVIEQFTVKEGNVSAEQRRLSQAGLIKGTKAKHKDDAPRHPIFEMVQQLVETAIAVNGQREDIRTHAIARLAHRVGPEVARRKRRGRVMSFSDLLQKVDDALEGGQSKMLLAALRSRYRVALVDEFQDTDPVQFRIFRRVFQEAAESANAREGRAFVMIGDPKQSIYKFRGADIHSYLAATLATPSKNRYAMSTNWRSDQSLVKAVQAIFKSVKDPFRHAEIQLPHVESQYGDRLPGQPALVVRLVPRHPHARPDKPPNKTWALQQAIRGMVIDMVTQLNDPPAITNGEGLSRRGVPGDLATLCRTGKQLRQIQRELAARGVPAVLHTDESIFESQEAEATALVMRALDNPGDLTSVSTALITPLFGLSAEELETLRHDERSYSRWGSRFFTWQALWYDRGFIAMWRRMLEEQSVISRLATRITGERQVTNYLHLGELLHQHASTAHAGPRQLLRWLERQISDPNARDDDASQLRLETDSAAVQLCTIHKSKGLEYPIVYCPTLWHVYGGPQDQFVVDRLDDENNLLAAPNRRRFERPENTPATRTPGSGGRGSTAAVRRPDPS